jgi:hypothetical protein
VQKISFPSVNTLTSQVQKTASQVQTLVFQVQKISFPSANISFPSAKNQLLKCKKISFPSVKPLQANRPLEPLDMREPCPIFFYSR